MVDFVLLRSQNSWRAIMLFELLCYYAWNGLLGTPFLLQCGIRQGGVLSPFLFAIYVNDLIDKLRQSGFGLYHYMLVHSLLVVFCTRTTLLCFLVVVMDSINLLISAMIMKSNGMLNLTPRKVRLQLSVVTPLLCPSN